MLEQSLKDRIEVYMKPDYIEVVEGSCELCEDESSGKTRLEVSLPSNVSVLCIRKHDTQPRCGFLNPISRFGLTKSVDHVLIAPDQSGRWTVHLIEMKSSLGRSEWKEIGLKARATILNMKAVAAILDLPITSFRVYTTYERLSLGTSDPTNMAGRKMMLGGGWKENEWDKNQLPIYVPKGKKEMLQHHGVKMVKESVDGQATLCGKLVLS